MHIHRHKPIHVQIVFTLHSTLRYPTLLYSTDIVVYWNMLYPLMVQLYTVVYSKLQKASYNWIRSFDTASLFYSCYMKTCHITSCYIVWYCVLSDMWSYSGLYSALYCSVFYFANEWNELQHIIHTAVWYHIMLYLLSSNMYNCMMYIIFRSNTLYDTTLY